MVRDRVNNPSGNLMLIFETLVPGSSQKMLDKSRGLTVDCVAYDLEDSVASEKKSEARANISSLLALPRVSSIREHAVRINSIGSGLEEDDLNAVVCPTSLPCEDDSFPENISAMRPTLIPS